MNPNRWQSQGLYNPQHEHDACGVGFVADIKGRRSNQVLRDALQILVRLCHRGAAGCEPNTGDGAGVLMQIPHDYLKQKCDQLSIALPAQGEYGVAVMFLPPEPSERYKCEKLF